MNTPPPSIVCPDLVLSLRWSGALLAALIATEGRAINMDNDTPEPAYRQKGLECLGYPGRPVNFIVYDAAQSTRRLSYCGGALLNRNWVITAGHCVHRWQGGGVFLVGTGTNVRYDTEHRIRVKRAVVNPLYGDDIYGATRVDLALLELETPINGYPDAILGTQTPADNALFSTAGFGTAGRPLAAVPPNGMTGFLRGWLAPKHTGSDPYGRLYIFQTRFIVGNYLHANGCPGDSGSPSYLWDPALKMHRLVGVLSGGSDLGCSKQSSNTIFVDLSEPIIRDWITEIIESPVESGLPQLTFSIENGAVTLRLEGISGDVSSWRVEESEDLHNWEGEYSFTSNVCRRPITGTKRYWRAYQIAASPLLSFANLGSLGTAADAAGKDIIAGIPGAITAASQNRALRTELAKIGGTTIAPYQVAFNPPGAFSVEIWARPGQDSQFTQMLTSYAPAPESGNLGGWMLQQGNGPTATTSGFSFSVFTTETDSSEKVAYAPMAVSSTAWHHVVGVYDGTQVEIYVDGVRRAQTAISPGYPLRSNSWAGVVIGGDRYWYLGDLDEPAIYPRALRAEEVLEHYQAGTAATPPVSYRDVVLGDGPVGYWPLDDEQTVPTALAAPVTAIFPNRAAGTSTEESCCGGGQVGP